MATIYLTQEGDTAKGNGIGNYAKGILSFMQEPEHATGVAESEFVRAFEDDFQRAAALKTLASLGWLRVERTAAPPKPGFGSRMAGSLISKMSGNKVAPS